MGALGSPFLYNKCMMAVDHSGGIGLYRHKLDTWKNQVFIERGERDHKYKFLPSMPPPLSGFDWLRLFWNHS